MVYGMEVDDFLEEVPSIIATRVVREEGHSCASSTNELVCWMYLKILDSIRPGDNRNKKDAHDHSAFDFVCHQVSSDDTTTHDSEPHLYMFN